MAGKSGAVGAPLGTYRIPVRSAVNALHGVRFAGDRQAPLTHMLTLDFEALGHGADACGLFLRLRERVYDWWRYQCGKGRPLGSFDWVFSHENPAPGQAHAHWLMRLPAGVSLDFLAVVADRLAKLTGRPLADCADALHLREAPTPGCAAKYLLKGVDDRFGPHLFIDTSPQGFVPGRRTGVSRSISRSGRKASGWVRKRRPRP